MIVLVPFRYISNSQIFSKSHLYFWHKRQASYYSRIPGKAKTIKVYVVIKTTARLRKTVIKWVFIIIVRQHLSSNNVLYSQHYVSRPQELLAYYTVYITTPGWSPVSSHSKSVRYLPKNYVWRKLCFTFHSVSVMLRTLWHEHLYFLSIVPLDYLTYCACTFTCSVVKLTWLRELVCCGYLLIFALFVEKQEVN